LEGAWAKEPAARNRGSALAKNLKILGIAKLYIEPPLKDWPEKKWQMPKGLPSPWLLKWRLSL